MFRFTFGYDDAATAIENAVNRVLDAGHRSADLGAAEGQAVNTEQMGDLIVEAMELEKK